MAFGKTAQKQSAQGNAQQESAYLKFGQGERVIRILDQEETEFYRYWLNVNVGGKQQGRSIVIGNKKDSPIYKYMQGLGEDHPDFRFPARRLLLNVLDRTPVKKTSTGLTVYADERGNFPNTDPVSEESVAKQPIVPNNKVYIMEFGPQLLDQMLVLHERIRDRETFEPLPIWRFDIKIVSRGAGKDTKRGVMPDVDQDPLPDELFSLPKYDLKLVCRPLPVQYQQRILDGEDYIELMRELEWDRPQATIPQF